MSLPRGARSATRGLRHASRVPGPGKPAAATQRAGRAECHAEHRALGAERVSGSPAGGSCLTSTRTDRAYEHRTRIMTSTPWTTDLPADTRPDTSPRPDATLLVSAVRAGLITAREVAERAVELRGSVLLLHGQPIAYARSHGVSGARDASDRERRVLRLLADTGLVPELCGRDDVYRAGRLPDGLILRSSSVHSVPPCDPVPSVPFVA